MPEKLAFVDIETSGPRVTRDRIIEIGIVRVENNKVTQTYNTLLDPQGYVSPYIERFTGITAADLEGAPTFTDKAGEIAALLEDCTFVAHNVRFDYGFLKNEFSRLELNFGPTHFCTVKLSQLLFPEYRRHNLDALIERFALECPKRHRAFEDAHVLWQFYTKAQEMFHPDAFSEAVKKALRRPSIPLQIDPESIKRLPESPGVYIFYDANNYPLYIGKSKNLKERVLSHFTSDHTSSKEMNISQQVARIETRKTAGELGALLKESSLVKEMQPLYNRKLRKTSQLILAKSGKNPASYDTVELETVDMIDSEGTESIIGVFRSRKQAKEALLAIAKEHSLCHKLLNLEKTTGACFPSQLGGCKGACTGKEPAALYNLRSAMAFSGSIIKPWPFTGPITIDEKDHTTGLHERFIVDKWCLIGRIKQDEFGDEQHEVLSLFDLDTYKILARYLTAGDSSTISTIVPREREPIS